jgi:drug/metabolite transporter (DMT)-like permease
MGSLSLGSIAQPLLGIICALTSAVVWGSGDFCGGQATRRHGPFQVLVLSAGSGIVLLVALSLWRGEALLPLGDVAWAASAGLLGALGIAALYRGLSQGDNAVVAPTSAVVGAIAPMLFSAITAGLPGTLKLAGFFLALPGIWLVSQSQPARRGENRRGLVLAFLAGFSFAAYFILIAQVGGKQVFMPLIVARTMSLIVALTLVKAQRLPLVSPRANPLALLAGVLDTGGNIFYLLAVRLTRLDIAAVLASLYPATTVILATLLLKERITTRQWGGIILCLAAIALIMA